MIIGLVGKPSSGKSSMFKAMTMIDVKISSVPFTTIKPNVGVGYAIVDCVCEEFGVVCKPKHGACKQGKRYVPIKIIDVAGLVPGAHEGRGLGNQFLDDLRQADVLIHIVDATGDTDAEGNPGMGDPEKDIEFLEKEIDLWFSSIIEKALRKFERKLAKMGKADLTEVLAEQLTGLNMSRSHVEQALNRAEEQGIKIDVNDKKGLLAFASELRKITKPIIIAANKIDLSKAQENYEKLKEKLGATVLVIPTSAEAEIALKIADENHFIDYLPGSSFTTKANLDEKQSKALEFIKLRILEKYGSTGVQQCINKAAFELLDHIVVYPVADRNKLSDREGHVFPDALIVPKGTTVKQLAYKVHTEIGDKFICGVDVRTKRRLAADYEVKNKDIIEIMTSK
ncbi:MAG: redox-regulated ATPase YchF [Kosmotogaceae bacterium]|nr:redox-regulated ATPase YchF [Kosmotogaceae bacterium]